MSDYPIIEQVALIIGNHLVREQAIAFPGIGTLYIRHRGAKKISKRIIEPPCRYVDFTSRDEEGKSLPELIAAEALCDLESAGRMYERWLTLVQDQERLTIVGVGTLSFKHFTMDKAFDHRLNPQGHAPIQLKSGRGFDWVTGVGILAILFALGIGGYQFWQSSESNPFEGLFAKHSEEVCTPAETASEEATSPTEEATETPVVEPIKQTEPTAPAVTTPTMEPQSLTSKRHYVVYGVFSTVENARKAVEELNMPTVAIYRFGSKFMVSPCSADDTAVCRSFMNEHSAELPNSWLYTAR